MYFRNDGDAKPDLLIFKLLLRPWDLAHRVERQKLMVTSREGVSVRVPKSSFMANLLLLWKNGPNILFEVLQSYIFGLIIIRSSPQTGIV